MTKSTTKKTASKPRAKKGNGAPNATKSSPPSVTKEKGKVDMIAEDGGVRVAPEGDGEKEAGIIKNPHTNEDQDGAMINGEPATMEELHKATQGSDEKAAA